MDGRGDRKGGPRTGEATEEKTRLHVTSSPASLFGRDRFFSPSPLPLHSPKAYVDLMRNCTFGDPRKNSGSSSLTEGRRRRSAEG